MLPPSSSSSSSSSSLLLLLLLSLQFNYWGVFNYCCEAQVTFYYYKLSLLFRLYCLPSSIRVATRDAILLHTFGDVITITKCWTWLQSNNVLKNHADIAGVKTPCNDGGQSLSLAVNCFSQRCTLYSSAPLQCHCLTSSLSHRLAGVVSNCHTFFFLSGESATVATSHLLTSTLLCCHITRSDSECKQNFGSRTYRITLT